MASIWWILPFVILNTCVAGKSKGVQPRYRVAISRGTITEGKVKTGVIATLNVWPEDGYIVGKVAAAIALEEYHVQVILPAQFAASATTFRNMP
jgi:hypothetical protein